MWDRETARRYDAWYATPTGQFALGREIRLLERMTADWPRRGQRLLEIGCGTGIFLETLHRAGFDVTGLDCSPAMLEAARCRLGPAADLHLGQAEHLPFDDKEFDYSVLFTVLEFCDDPGLALREAARVTRKTVLLAFLNGFSLHWLASIALSRQGGRLLRQAHWLTPWAAYRLIRDNLGRRPGRLRSVLPGPRATWRQELPWRLLNGPILACPVGAICARTIDLTAGPMVTPLPAFKAKACIG